MVDMYYDGSYYGDMELDFFLVWYLLYYGVALLISIAAYVLQSVSLFTVAKRRCIRKPWLAWVPVGNLWILGSIADQYRYVAQGQIKNKRKALLILEILVAALGTVCSVLFGALIAQVIAYDDTMFAVDHRLEMELIGTIMGVVGVGLLVGGIKVASTVIQYMADYDLYRSCEPKSAVLYLVLSIIFNITRPIFMLVCCKKDEGMPPRRQQSAATPEVIPLVAQPAAEPEAAPQPQPVIEPWERPAEE